LTHDSSFIFLLFIPTETGEKPIVIRAEIQADRVPDTPANTFISISGKEKDVFWNMLAYFCHV